MNCPKIFKKLKKRGCVYSVANSLQKIFFCFSRCGDYESIARTPLACNKDYYDPAEWFSGPQEIAFSFVKTNKMEQMEEGILFIVTTTS